MSLSATASAAGNPWLRVLSALEKKITRLSYDTWLKPTRFSHIIGSTIYVRVPTPEFRHIEEKFGDLIQEALDVLSPEYQDVKYITAEEDKTVAPVRPAAGFPPVSASTSLQKRTRLWRRCVPQPGFLRSRPAACPRLPASNSALTGTRLRN